MILRTALGSVFPTRRKRDVTPLVVRGVIFAWYGRKRREVWSRRLSRPFVQPPDHPTSAIEVVHNKDSIRFEPSLHIPKRLLCEQEALQAQARVTGVEDQRVDHGITHQVVGTCLRRTKLRPSSM